jgi:hypothetical protein
MVSQSEKPTMAISATTPASIGGRTRRRNKLSLMLMYRHHASGTALCKAFPRPAKAHSGP